MTILFKTKLRKKLLSYFFTHCDENFYVRELANLILEDAGNLSRELRILEKEGLCVSSSRGRLKFYSLNKGYPLFNELKKIVFKTEGVAGSLKDLVARYKGITRAFIHGSFAKGKEGGSSDIDMVVVGTFPLDQFTGRIRDLESQLNREINFSSFTQKEFENERKKIGGFLNIVLKDKVVLLKGDLRG